LPGNGHPKFTQKRREDRDGLYAELDEIQRIGRDRLPALVGGQRITPVVLPPDRIVDLPSICKTWGTGTGTGGSSDSLLGSKAR